MDFAQALGLNKEIESPEDERQRLQLYINLKLASSGQPTCVPGEVERFFGISRDLLKSYREKNRLLSEYHCWADQRIQNFLTRYFEELELDSFPTLPTQTFILDRHGVARELSLPMGADEFHSEIVSSYRIRQGVLHNPASDRRTTKGSFHVTEGGLPIPGDKKAVPKITFAHMLNHALNPPRELLTVPFTAALPEPARMFASLLLRPVVVPAVPDLEPEKTMEIRFFAPGNLVSNLDFVESIFGNAGNPHLAECDAGLDVEHWTGHTGCAILAPHLVGLTKQEVGLPHWEQASERQRHDGMCWKEPGELYNDGQAFKLTARDESGVIVTLLADNYFGYCKKEVKTQIGFSANLYGLSEEEHAGGALAFPRRNHGEEFGVDSRTQKAGYSFADMVERYGAVMDVQAQGYAIDKRYPELIYIPQKVRMDLNAQTLSWEKDGALQTIRLHPDKVYMQPSGYKIEMEKHPGAPSWRLVGTNSEGTFCHKPCTVSGGGKSEISKSLNDAVIYRPLFVDDLDKDLDRVQEIFDRDYTRRFKSGHEHEDRDATRKPLSFLCHQPAAPLDRGHAHREVPGAGVGKIFLEGFVHHGEGDLVPGHLVEHDGHAPAHTRVQNEVQPGDLVEQAKNLLDVGVHQVERQPHRVFASQDAAGDGEVDAEAPPGFGDARDPQRPDLAHGHHPQRALRPFELGQLARQGLDQPVAEDLARRVAPDVGRSWAAELPPSNGRLPVSI